MFRYLVLAALVAFAAGSPTINVKLNPLTPTGRIVGGTNVTIQEVPYQVHFYLEILELCGGSIISEDWVVSAAHCFLYSFASFPISSYTVRVGTTMSNVGGYLHSVSKIITHEDYRTNQHGIPFDDIAVVKLTEPIRFDVACQPIPLFHAGEEAVEGAYSIITGWGALSEEIDDDDDDDDGDIATILQIVSVPVVSKAACNESYATLGGIPHGQICAGYPQGGKDACQGDSGGPMVIDGRLAGIVSWGSGCAQPGKPGVYTEVAWYRKWIANKTSV